MSIEAMKQALDLSTPKLREMVTRHAAAIDPRATLEDMPEALAFQIDMARALLKEFTAIQQADAQQPATGEHHWEVQRLIDTLRTDASGGRAATVHELDAAADLIEASLFATGEPVVEPFVATYSSESIGGKQHDTGRVNKGPRGGFFASTASVEDASLIADALNAYTHPAPSVPDAAIDSAIYNQCPDFDDWHEGPSIDDIRAIVRAAMSNTTEPVKVAPYNPTEEMRWAMKRIDPALSSEQCRALWSAAWSASQSTHPAPSVPDAVARNAERYRFIRDADVSDDLIPDIALYAMESLDEYIDAAMLAAKEGGAA